MIEAKDDWGKGTLIIGIGKDETILPLFLTQYRGETQEDNIEFTADGYETKSDDSQMNLFVTLINNNEHILQ